MTDVPKAHDDSEGKGTIAWLAGVLTGMLSGNESPVPTKYIGHPAINWDRTAYALPIRTASGRRIDITVELVDPD